MPEPVLTTAPAAAGTAAHARPTPMRLVVLAALLLAGASLLLGHALRFDAHGWLRWGREIGRGDGTFDTSGYPSWKPLPLLLAVPLAATGAAAPLLWLLALRTAGLLALATVWRLTARRAGARGGAAAAALLALAPSWWSVLLGGGIEPAVVALGCAAVAAAERSRPGQALALLSAMALAREEALLLVLVYGGAHRRRGPRWRLATGAAAAGIVAAWLLGDWLGSGDPLHGGALARAARTHVSLAGLHGGALLAGIVVAASLLTLIGLGLRRAVRSRDHTILAVAAAGLGWLLTDLALMALGYPLPARFLLPAAATFAATAGVGATVVERHLTGAP